MERYSISVIDDIIIDTEKKVCSDYTKFGNCRGSMDTKWILGLKYTLKF